MNALKTLPAAEPVGWYVRTKRTDEDRDGFMLADFGCGYAAGASRSMLAAIASEAINATRETGIGPAEMRRQRDELLEELKSWMAQHACGCGHAACKRCADDASARALVARVEP